MAIRFLDEDQTATATTPRRIRFLDEPPSPSSPVQRTEAQISQRESMVPVGREAMLDPLLSLFNPRRNAERLMMPGIGLGKELGHGRLQRAAALAGLQEQLESITAAPIVSKQAGRPIFEDLKRVARGERVVERGDIARNVGAPEPVAAMFGLATSPEAVLPGMAAATKGLRGGAQAAEAMALGRPATLLKPNPVREQLVRRVQQRLLRAPKLAGHDFERGLEEVVTANPDQAVDLSASLGSYLAKAKENPAFGALIQRQVLNHQESALVQSLLNQPNTAASLTLKDSQKLKGIFQRVNKQRFQQVDPEFVGAHLDALEVWHDIRLAQLQAFPQFKPVLQGYAAAMQDFRVIKNALKEGALEPQLLKNFGENSQRIRAFRELATPDTLRLVERLLKASATRHFFTRLGVRSAQIGGGLAIAGALRKPIGALFGGSTGGSE